jgi:hypothetical protein
MSDDDMKAELERLRKENEALKKGASDGMKRYQARLWDCSFTLPTR